MNGITGRMGYRQHLVRSILPIRDQGGVTLPNGDVVQVVPIIVGRNEEKLREIAAEHGITEWSTDTENCMERDDVDVYFDAQLTSRRYPALTRAIEAGKHIFTEKPTAETLTEAIVLARLAKKASPTGGARQVPPAGPRQAASPVDEGCGRIISMRGEFGYWVWEGTTPRRSVELELPQGGRRWHDHRHVPALELRDRRHHRSHQDRLLPTVTTSPSVSTRTVPPTPAPRRRGLRSSRSRRPGRRGAGGAEPS
jgi:predicted dehydrogenase